MIKKTLKSFQYAFRGIWIVGRFERNARVHLAATIIILIASFAFDIKIFEFLFILLAIALVWICETFNTAIEKLVDLVSPGQNEIAGKVKDLSAGAVLFAAIFALIVGVIVFGPRVVELF